MSWSIFIQGVGNKTITINGDFSGKTKISELKLRLKEKEGLEIAEQRLMFHGKPISKDDLTFADYNIRHESTLFLSLRCLGGEDKYIEVSTDHDGSSKSIGKDKKITYTTLIETLRSHVKEKCGFSDSKDVVMIYGTVILYDGKKLKDYGIGESIVKLEISLKKDVATKVKNLPKEFGVVVSYEPDCMDPFSDDSAKAKMPCGHVISSESITQYVRSLSDNKQDQITCPGLVSTSPVKKCNAVWDWKIVDAVGVFTTEEQKEFDYKLSRNYSTNKLCVQECPGCKTYIFKDENVKGNRVKCPYKSCTRGDFCWKCCKTWKNSSDYGERCGNPDCDDVEYIKGILRDSPKKTISNWPDMPSTRCCPKCGTLIYHADQCKHMTCRVSTCKTQFCFICLKIKQDDKWQCGSYADKCMVADTQTTIPGR